MATQNWLISRAEQWPTAKLLPYARNARTHTEAQVGQIAASIQESGFTNPILAGTDGVIVAGHRRLAAAQRLGLDSVPVIVLDHLSATQRRALVLADNRIAANAGWDEELLKLEIAELDEADFNLDLMGFGDEELERLLNVWVLGQHRLLCGDSTVLSGVERLMNGQLADMASYLVQKDSASLDLRICEMDNAM